MGDVKQCYKAAIIFLVIVVSGFAKTLFANQHPEYVIAAFWGVAVVLS